MGAYLSEPNLKKESLDDDLGQLSYGASSMQGWRLEQEDAHNAILNFDSETNTSFFAVYDGHGGAAVAQYCAKYLPAYLKTLDEYKKGELVDALKALFLKFDESLLSEKAEKELRELQEGSVHEDETSENGNKKDSDEDEEEEETDSETDKENNKKKTAKKEYVNEADALCDEACMPLEEVLKRYSNTEKKVKKALKKNADTTTHTMSPAINAAGSSRKKNKLANQNNNEAEVPKSANDFNQQEELDITEIKKNGNLDEETNGTNQQNENDFDEASNLCDLTDSQKSINGSDTANNTLNKTDLNKSTGAAAPASGTAVSSASNATEVTNNNELTIPKTPKPKMTKEELKLSPIRKKSLSSSSLTEDALSSTTTENNMNGSCSVATNNDENKENNDAEPTAAVAASSTESVVAVESTALTIEPVETNNNTSNKKAGLTRNHLIAKLLAGCIKEKLKQSTKQKSKQKKAELIDNVDDEEEEDEDYQVPKSLDEDEDLDEDDDDDDDDDESDEDFESDEDDDDEEVDDEEDEEEEEEEEETDYSTQQGGNRPGYDSGCTAVVALLRENKHLYVANAGDSRCVVCRDGKAIEMSFDHKPEDDLERERVEKAGGHVTKDGRINNGLNLSRAIGDHSYKANKELPLSDQMITSLPDVKMLDIDLSKDLFMVLACDGIWNFMSSQDVCDFIQERLNANYSKLSQICEELFMHCLAPNSEGDGTGCDNMTCILVTFNPFRKVEFKLNRLVDNNIENQSLKRSLENGTANNNTGLNQSPSTLAKKLKQDQQESKHLV